MDSSLSRFTRGVDVGNFTITDELVSVYFLRLLKAYMDAQDQLERSPEFVDSLKREKLEVMKRLEQDVFISFVVLYIIAHSVFGFWMYFDTESINRHIDLPAADQALREQINGADEGHTRQRLVSADEKCIERIENTGLAEISGYPAHKLALIHRVLGVLERSNQWRDKRREHSGTFWHATWLTLIGRISRWNPLAETSRKFGPQACISAARVLSTAAHTDWWPGFPRVFLSRLVNMRDFVVPFLNISEDEFFRVPVFTKRVLQLLELCFNRFRGAHASHPSCQSLE
ncbi:unnamed protein product [Schistocephalus solidus]|uniref:DUF155 domain-containing protein n=1 Tax=Schistocephalus solidus TaxID=70667 RepID=A0A183SFV3_SCHSO|nr:unnamed protein product [Schistocephalus solidus]